MLSKNKKKGIPMGNKSGDIEQHKSQRCSSNKSGKKNGKK